MARINLLPWRAERRKQREREFYMMLGASALAAVLVFLGATYWMGQRIDNQTARNNYLDKQIKDLDVKIEKIKDLEKTRSQLLARKQIIEDLQSNRSQMVHLFDQLAKTIPNGTRLTSLKQANDVLTLEGLAESSTRVATYMRNMENSPQMGRSDLAKIESKEGTPGVDKKMPNVFSLSLKLKKPDDAQNSTEMPLPQTPGANAATPPKPAVDIGAQLNDAASQLTAKPAPAPPAAPAPAKAEEKKP
jgi:type IV pilus assembly protein PilN